MALQDLFEQQQMSQRSPLRRSAAPIPGTTTFQSSALRVLTVPEEAMDTSKVKLRGIKRSRRHVTKADDDLELHARRKPASAYNKALNDLYTYQLPEVYTEGSVYPVYERATRTGDFEFVKTKPFSRTTIRPRERGQAEVFMFEPVVIAPSPKVRADPDDFALPGDVVMQVDVKKKRKTTARTKKGSRRTKLATEGQCLWGKRTSKKPSKSRFASTAGECRIHYLPDWFIAGNNTRTKQNYSWTIDQI